MHQQVHQHQRQRTRGRKQQARREEQPRMMNQARTMNQEPQARTMTTTRRTMTTFTTYNDENKSRHLQLFVQNQCVCRSGQSSSASSWFILGLDIGMETIGVIINFENTKKVFRKILFTLVQDSMRNFMSIWTLQSKP